VRADDRDTVMLSWNPTPPVSGSVQISLKIAEIDDDVYMANKARIDKAIDQGNRGINELLNLKGVDLLSAPSVTTMPSLKATIDIVREFPFATSFAVPKLTHGTLLPGVALPPTPSQFVTHDVGISADITPSVLNDQIDLYCNLHIIDFVGFTETNQAIKSPAFETREVNLLEEFDKGTEMKGALIPGFRFDEETVTDRDKAGKVVSTTQKTVKKRLVVFLSASQVPSVR
jgi:hypothetical protein